MSLYLLWLLSLCLGDELMYRIVATTLVVMYQCFLPNGSCYFTVIYPDHGQLLSPLNWLNFLLDCFLLFTWTLLNYRHLLINWPFLGYIFTITSVIENIPNNSLPMDVCQKLPPSIIWIKFTLTQNHLC